MKVLGVQQSLYRSNLSAKNRQNQTIAPKYYASDGIAFGIANSAPLKTLFKFGLPCMYTGVEMIDPKHAHKVIKSGIFEKAAYRALPALETFEHNMQGVEKRVFRVLKAQSAKHPQLTFQSILDSRADVYQYRLREKQRPIFKRIIELSQSLPPELREGFDDFMRGTEDRLNDRPVVAPFNKFDFMYKLQKIKGDVETIANPKAAKVVAKIQLEAENFSEIDSVENQKEQQKVINFLEVILNKSVLKNYEPLKQLITTTKSKINRVPQLIPFSRKSFIFALDDLLRNIEDQNLRSQMVDTAKKLPTSRDTIAAYVVKFRNEPSSKIAYRLLCPTFASVEHIHPRSMGGQDLMSNFGGATVRENSDRGNIDFTEQIVRRPGTKKNSQKYVNKLIELVNKGVFKRYNINPQYIDDFSHTIDVESQGQIKLNTRKLHKK